MSFSKKKTKKKILKFFVTANYKTEQIVKTKVNHADITEI